jgi:hypothetical protein
MLVNTSRAKALVTHLTAGTGGLPGYLRLQLVLTCVGIADVLTGFR